MIQYIHIVSVRFSSSEDIRAPVLVSVSDIVVCAKPFIVRLVLLITPSGARPRQPDFTWSVDSREWMLRHIPCPLRFVALDVVNPKSIDSVTVAVPSKL
jgi:hypothetical protein